MPASTFSDVRAANVLVVSTSLNPGSRSFVLAEEAIRRLRLRYPGLSADLADLRSIARLPLAGSPEADEPHPDLDALLARMRQASHLLFAVPIYNYGTASSAKNLVELMITGDVDLEGKTVGFLCSAAGSRSYMAVLGLANSLMLDFRCWIVPRFVYATGADFTDGKVASMDIDKRIDLLLEEMFERGPRPEEV